MGVAVVIPDGTEGEGFGFFLESKASGVVAFDFGSFDCGWFEKCDEQGSEHVARPDNPGGHAVNAGVEVIQSDMDAVSIAVGDNFAGDGQEIVGEGDYVVAVPMNAATDVEHNLRQELEDTGDFI